MTGPPGRWVGVVLAGGRSRRFGRDKALMLYVDPGSPGDSENLGCRALRLLEPLVDERVLVRTEPLPGRPSQVRVVADPRPGGGPVQALSAAFDAVDAESWLVAPCDMPLLRPELYLNLLPLLREHELACFRLRGQLQPLVSVWTPAGCDRLREVARSTLGTVGSQGREVSLHQVIGAADAGILEVSARNERCFLNVNTLEEYRSLTGSARNPEDGPGEDSRG